MDEMTPFLSMKSSSKMIFALTALAFVAVLSVTMISISDDCEADATTFIADGIKYEITSESTVSVVSNSYSGDIVIPSSVKYEGNSYSVTALGDRAFENCMYLTSVQLPDGLMSVGAYAFDLCESLTNIKIPNSVTNIGWYAFDCCKSLKTVDIGRSGFSEVSYTFSGCHALQEVIVSDDNLHHCSVDGVLFDKNKTSLYLYPAGKTLESYVIPNTVMYIGSEAFCYCSDLKSVTITESVIDIGYRSFSFCDALISVVIPDSVENISEMAFFNCQSLVSVHIGKGAVQIGEYAFGGSNSLEYIDVDKDNIYYSSEDGVLFNHDKTELIQYPQKKAGDTYTIPNTVSKVGIFSFMGCSYLKSVEVPSGVTSIGNYAFRDSSLEYILLPDTVESLGHSAFSECISLKSVVLSDNLTILGADLFFGCTSLASVTIPDSVSSIGSMAFYKSALRYVVIPDGVTSVGNEAFSGCKSLEIVEIGKGVTMVGDKAFRDCISLKTVNILGNFTELGKGVLDGCSVLEHIEVFKDNVNYYSDNGVLLNKAKTDILLYPTGRTAKSYTVADTITSIGAGTFKGCLSLETVIIPDSVLSIGSEAFYECHNLKEVNIPCSITKIEDYTFHGCSSLKQIVIPDSVTIIGNYAFWNCKELKSLSIPANVTALGDHSLSYCTALASIDISANITGIGKSVFDGCSSLKDINVSSDNSNYCSDNGILFNKNKTILIKYPEGKDGSSYTVPEGVQSMPSFAFDHIQQLRLMTLPASFVTYEENSIGYCSNMTEIKVSENNIMFSSKDGILFNKDMTTLIKCPSGYRCSTYYVPDTVVTIDGKLEGIIGKAIIPASVKVIKDNAFNGVSMNSLYLKGCHITSGYLLNDWLNTISIDKDTVGAHMLFGNYTFATSDGTPIDLMDIAGYTYQRNDAGVMVRVGEPSDPSGHEGGFNYWLLLIPAIAIIVAIDLIISKYRR